MTTLMAHTGLASGIMSLTLFSHAMAAPPEPDLEQIISWTVERAELTPGGLDLIARRARSAASIPDVTLRYAYGLDDRMRSSIDSQGHTLDQSVDSSLAEGRDHRVEGVLRWRLSRLRFHPIEPRLLLQKQRQNQRRLELSTRATRAFLKWQMYRRELRQLDAQYSKETPRTEQRATGTKRHRPGLNHAKFSISERRERLVLLERLRMARGELDVLTGGRFSRALRAEVRR